MWAESLIAGMDAIVGADKRGALVSWAMCCKMCMQHMLTWCTAPPYTLR